jgi:integrase
MRSESSRKLERTGTPGIFRRHTKNCDRKGRCECSYVVVWRHRGKQHTETYRTFAEAREAKGNRDAGDRRPVARVGFEDYFTGWIDSYAGRTSRGFSDRSRVLYRRHLEQHAMPRWGTWRLADVEPADARQLFATLRNDRASQATMKGLRAALSAMFATAVEDRLLRSNPVQGVRIPAAADGITPEERAKALTRAELALLLAALPADWRLFFEFLTHTGLRISEALAITWRHLDLGTSPRVLVREQYCEGERRRLKSHCARRGPAAIGWDGRAAADASARLLPRRGHAGVRFRRRDGAEPVEPCGPGAQAGGGGRGASVGQFPHLPAHLREPLVRGAQEREAGAGVAGACRPRFHAPHLCASSRRRAG